MLANATALLAVLSGTVVHSQQSDGLNGGDRGYGVAGTAAPDAFEGLDRGAADAAVGARGTASSAPSPPEQTAAPGAAPAEFSSAQDAVSAFIKALRGSDRTKLREIFGSQIGLLYSGDEIAERTAMARFLRYYDQQHALSGSDTVTLVVGETAWRFPIPIVKRSGNYYFDTAAGVKQIVHRRIRRNEVGAISVCNAYVAAQREYALVGHDGQAAGQYAQTLISDAGKQNGLFWTAKAGEPRSPVGPLLADAATEGYRLGSQGTPTPYHGYLYRTLIAQGSYARDGARSYLRDGKQVTGFALVAYPAQHGKSGVKTFIVNQDSIVYEKDLGERTAEIVREMREFDPEPSWSPAL